MREELTVEEYRILVEKAPMMIWRSDLTMGCDYFNEVWLAFTGRPPEEEWGNGWAQGVHPDDVERCLRTYVDHFARREVFEMQYRLRRSDGVYRWLFDRGVPYADSHGTFKGYIGSCIDVTETVEAQSALKKAQEAEIRQLQGFLPICAYCKRIRNHEDYWEQVEAYISKHSSALFSHGICPECEVKVRAEIAALAPPSGGL